MMNNPLRTDTPPNGQQAWVWHWIAWVRATWDGAVWRNGHGVVLDGVTHWRPVSGVTGEKA
jgi:hypothetical protein